MRNWWNLLARTVTEAAMRRLMGGINRKDRDFFRKSKVFFSYFFKDTRNAKCPIYKSTKLFARNVTIGIPQNDNILIINT